MSNSASGSGFLSGFSGGFTGMNGQQHLQNQGGALGFSMNNQYPEPSNYLAGMENDQIQPLVDMNSSVENDSRSVSLREWNVMNPRDSSMVLGGEKVCRPIPVMGSSRTIHLNEDPSDEDYPSFEEDNVGDARGEKGEKDNSAPWRRMKWTDEIVRLLIQVVASVGEDGSLEGAYGTRRKSVIIKKGKWRMVSKILISKGYQASPQQCEDKFNDLNKRYKKLNDILGREMSCKVVENPSLLENMSNLSAKAKEEAKKLLDSKHLFYREICAYHSGQPISNCRDLDVQIHPRSLVEKNHGVPPVQGNSMKDKDVLAEGQYLKQKDALGDEVEGAEEDDSSEDDLSDEEADYNECGSQDNVMEQRYVKRVNSKVGNGKMPYSSRLENLQAEIANIFNDPTKSKNEQREWIKKRMLQLDEERIGIQAEAFELENRRSKWRRFCDKKESELGMARLDMEGMMLEYKTKSLQLKKSGTETDFGRSGASFAAASCVKDVVESGN